MGAPAPNHRRQPPAAARPHATALGHSPPPTAAGFPPPPPQTFAASKRPTAEPPPSWPHYRHGSPGSGPAEGPASRHDTPPGERKRGFLWRGGRWVASLGIAETRDDGKRGVRQAGRGDRGTLCGSRALKHRDEHVELRSLRQVRDRIKVSSGQRSRRTSRGTAPRAAGAVPGRCTGRSTGMRVRGGLAARAPVPFLSPPQVA